MEFKHAQLDNGLDIIGEVNPSAASVALGFFVRTGSRDETAKVAGVSHFLEHMVFKGTARRSPFDINLEFDRLGAVYNAFTSEENTVYFGAVLPEFQGPLLDLLGDMLRPSLRVEDFNTEKNVILEEIALYEDRPHYRVQEKLMAAYFGRHPLHRSVLGTPRTIKALKRDDMLAYFNRRYSPSNVVLVGVGRLDWDAFVSKAKQACAHWENFQVARKTTQAKGTGKMAVMKDAKLLRQHIGMMSPAPSAQDEDRYAAILLSSILGDATGSRLYYALIDPGIADEAGADFESFDGAGSIVTYVCTAPDKAAQAYQIVRHEYQRFMAEGPTQGEMTAAKNKTASGATLKGELPMGRLTALGFDWTYRHSYRPLGEHIEKIMAVTPGQIHDLARKYDLESMSVLTLGPLDKLA